LPATKYLAGRTQIPTLNRRHFLGGSAAAGATSAGGLPSFPTAWAAPPDLAAALPAGVRASAVLDALPGKKPLIKLSYRPPNYETPVEYFREAITSNDAFFVRYHLAVIPEVDLKTWKISVGGDGANGQLADQQP
jgi:sulfite dehydrogenase (cytochrome) subunit A